MQLRVVREPLANASTEIVHLSLPALFSYRRRTGTALL